jgi:hypothetical protein
MDCKSSHGRDRDDDGASRIRSEEQRQQQQQEEQQRRDAAQRRQTAEQADLRGRGFERSASWQDAVNWFTYAVQLAPDNAAFRADLLRATSALHDASSAAQIHALQQKFRDSAAAQQVGSLSDRTQDDAAARRIAEIGVAFGNTAASARLTQPVPAVRPARPIAVPVPAPGMVLYPVLSKPVPPNSPIGATLARAQPQIRTVDARLRGAEEALRRLIRSNDASEEERGEWVRSSEEASIEAADLAITLTLDLAAANTEVKQVIQTYESEDVLTRLLSRSPQEAHRKSLHTAYGILKNRKAELERESKAVYALSKASDLRTRVRDFSMKNSELTRRDVWDSAMLLSRPLEDAGGTWTDLSDAALVIYKQASSLERLAVIQNNQEQSLKASQVLRAYIHRLQIEKASQVRAARN